VHQHQAYDHITLQCHYRRASSYTQTHSDTRQNNERERHTVGIHCGPPRPADCWPCVRASGRGQQLRLLSSLPMARERPRRDAMQRRAPRWW
jgi:hypothetical protein